MGRSMGKVQEKGSISLTTDEIHGLFGETSRQIGQRNWPVHHVGIRHHRERDHVVAIWNAIELVEPVIAGEKALSGSRGAICRSRQSDIPAPSKPGAWSVPSG